VFLGNHRNRVDAKGRVALPAQYRRLLPEGSVVAFGNEGRLVIHPPAEWAEREQEYRLTAETPAEMRKLLRQLYSSAKQVEVDGQGRMLLDARHRIWASIGDVAVFVGLSSVVEIVGEAVWDAEQASMTPEQFTALNDRVFARSGSAPAGPAASA
jgi:MraZ protein